MCKHCKYFQPRIGERGFCSRLKMRVGSGGIPCKFFKKLRAYSLNQIGIKDISYPDWPDWFIESTEKLKGYCLYCGKKLADKRRRYCIPKDENEFPTHKNNCWCAVNDLHVTPVRRMVHRIFKFECQDCGEHFSFKTPAGAELPYHCGENHHIISLKDGGLDHIDNMILLCSKCHKKRTYSIQESPE